MHSEKWKIVYTLLRKVIYMCHNFVILIQVMLIKIFLTCEFFETRERRKVSSLKSALLKLNCLSDTSEGMVMGNNNCISFLQFESEVADCFKDDHDIRPGKLKNVACGNIL